MTEAELIERMARAIDPAAWDTRVMESIPDPKNRQLISKVHARDTLRAIREAGCEVVPVEPTYEMFIAAEKAGVSFQSQRRCWPAMLSASPLKGDA